MGRLGLNMGVQRFARVGAKLNQNDSAIVAVINSITGDEDSTYVDAVGSLADVIGAEATGVINTDIEAISQVLEADSD